MGLGRHSSHVCHIAIGGGVGSAPIGALIQGRFCRDVSVSAVSVVSAFQLYQLSQLSKLSQIPLPLGKFQIQHVGITGSIYGEI